mmetsp:Transcript_59643/g.141926  ORF Transcript_59643/g.141926 Transcript_59643/m.141926 type:complete len:308 (+) Transcript_59643:117-1040(+)
MLLLFLFFYVASLAAAPAGASPARGSVLQLTAAEFKDLVTPGEHIWFVHFYHEGSKKTLELQPVWRQVAKELEGVVKIAAVDCAVEAPQAARHQLTWEKICKKSPALEAYAPNAAGAVKRRSYSGPQTAKALVKWAADLLPSDLVATLSTAKGVSVLHKTNVDEFLRSSKTMAKVLVCVTKKTTPTMVKALALFYKGRLKFGVIQPAEVDLRRRFGNVDPPAVLVLEAGSVSDPVPHRGAFSRDAIQSFLSPFAAPRTGRRHSGAASAARASEPEVQKVRVKSRSASGSAQQDSEKSPPRRERIQDL